MDQDPTPEDAFPPAFNWSLLPAGVPWKTILVLIVIAVVLQRF